MAEHLWKVVAEDHDRCQNCGLGRVLTRTRFDSALFYVRWGPGEKAIRPSKGKGIEPPCNSRDYLSSYAPSPLLQLLSRLSEENGGLVEKNLCISR